MYLDSPGVRAGATPPIAFSLSKNCTMVNPKPIKPTAVRAHDISVRSVVNRVRSHEK
jgi:hypothetical protein